MELNSNSEQKICRNDQYSREEYDEMINGEIENISDGVLEILPDGFGFLRGQNYQSTPKDIYIGPMQIKRFNLKTGDRVRGVVREPINNEKFRAMIFIKEINDLPLEAAIGRKNFDKLVPTYPTEKIVLENGKENVEARLIDLMAPIGKGQRGMIVAPPRTGKTSLLKNIANSILKNNKDVELMILLVDERPEEVTDIRDFVDCDVIASTFDQEPQNHIKVAEMVLSRAKGLVEMGKDVVILMDSLTRLARAHNLTVNSSGRTLSGGLDPASLYGPKKFFGAARNIREGGSLTIIATALVETGSRMDDVIFEEFKGTGNMEIVLDRKLSERRIFPALDIYKSATRKEELLLSKQEIEAGIKIRKSFANKQSYEIIEEIIATLKKTKTNKDFVKVANTIE